jgi:hypothetical protein
MTAARQFRMSLTAVTAWVMRNEPKSPFSPNTVRDADLTPLTLKKSRRCDCEEQKLS